MPSTPLTNIVIATEGESWTILTPFSTKVKGILLTFNATQILSNIRR